MLERLANVFAIQQPAHNRHHRIGHASHQLNELRIAHSHTPLNKHVLHRKRVSECLDGCVRADAGLGQTRAATCTARMMAMTIA